MVLLRNIDKGRRKYQQQRATHQLGATDKAWNRYIRYQNTVKGIYELNSR
jgi:hypothetical protein